MIIISHHSLHYQNIAYIEVQNSESYKNGYSQKNVVKDCVIAQVCVRQASSLNIWRKNKACIKTRNKLYLMLWWWYHEWNANNLIYMSMNTNESYNYTRLIYRLFLKVVVQLNLCGVYRSSWNGETAKNSTTCAPIIKFSSLLANIFYNYTFIFIFFFFRLFSKYNNSFYEIFTSSLNNNIRTFVSIMWQLNIFEGFLILKVILILIKLYVFNFLVILGLFDRQSLTRKWNLQLYNSK